MKNSIFAKRIKELRANKNISLRQLGQHLNLSPSILCYYESGEKTPSNHSLMKIASFYNVSSDYLLGMDYINEDRNEEYLKDDTILKIIRRSAILTNFILEDPRKNSKILEDFVISIKKATK